MIPAPNLILDKSFSFAKKIILFTDCLYAEKKIIIANQLLKSGTSIGANIHEAQAAESKADFVHKLKISYKEAEETEYWLKLISEVYQLPETERLLDEVVVLKKIMNKIISTTLKKCSSNGNADLKN